MPNDLRDPKWNPEAFVTINGARIERDILGVVVEINSRWPNLRVQYLDPDSVAGLVDAPYQIVETDAKGRDRVILQVWELNKLVIRQLEQFDSFNGFDIEKYLADSERKRKKAEQQHWENLKGEMLELSEAVFKSTKDTYTFKDERTGKTVKTRQSGRHEVISEPS